MQPLYKLINEVASLFQLVRGVVSRTDPNFTQRYFDISVSRYLGISIFRYLGKNGGLPREGSNSEASAMLRNRSPLEANRHFQITCFETSLANRGLPREVCNSEPKQSLGIAPLSRQTSENEKQCESKPRVAYLRIAHLSRQTAILVNQSWSLNPRIDFRP